MVWNHATAELFYQKIVVLYANQSAKTAWLGAFFVGQGPQLVFYCTTVWRRTYKNNILHLCCPLDAKYKKKILNLLENLADCAAIDWIKE